MALIDQAEQDCQDAEVVAARARAAMRPLSMSRRNVIAVFLTQSASSAGRGKMIFHSNVWRQSEFWRSRRPAWGLPFEAEGLQLHISVCVFPCLPSPRCLVLPMLAHAG